MQVGDFRGRGAARVDVHDAHGGPRRLRRRDALVEHRVAPREVGADEDDQVRRFQIFVRTRHGVRTEGALVPGHSRRHAEAGISVDVGRPDEALHQLVGDVIVLGQQLPGTVYRHAIWAVFRYRLAEG